MNPYPTRLAFRIALLSLAGSLPLGSALRAQAPSPAPAVDGQIGTNAPAAISSVQLTSEQLESLLGPIALYPDALIALILPASTSPSDVVLAARYLGSNGDPAQVDSQNWDESVRGLAHYPEVVQWMDENLSWTKQVGEAFLAQPTDVMQAVQRLRTLARAAGTLVDTPQQKIVTEGDILLIEPAQPNVIYVPRYDPDIVYVTRSPGWNQPYLSFGLGFAVGSWLAYDFDWPARTIWVGDWRRQSHTVWVRPSFPNRPQRPGINFPVARPWHPPDRRYVPSRIVGPRPPGVVIYPRPMPGTPPRPPGFNPPQRHFDPPGQPRLNRPGTPGGPSGFSVPPVVMPPAHNIGLPQANDRDRDRPEAAPDRGRTEIRRTPPTVNPAPVINAPPRINPPPSAIAPGGVAPTDPRREHPSRPDNGDRGNNRPNEGRRESRASTPPPAQPAALPKPAAPEPNNGAQLP